MVTTTLVAIGVALGLVIATILGGRWYVRRSGRRALLRFRARVDRFKLASRASVRERLLNDPVVAAAVANHVASGGATEAAWNASRIRARLSRSSTLSLTTRSGIGSPDACSISSIR